MDAIKVLNVTSHLGGGLGTAIGSYIAESELHHSILELEKTINPCTDQFDLKGIVTLYQKEDFAKIAADFDVLLFHYHCHPLITWALLEINRYAKNKVVTWCHNNGMDTLHPLPDMLNTLTDSVILSGCNDRRFIDCDIIRPIPLMTSLDEAANRLFSSNKSNEPSFRYIGSLSESKIHESAFEWFSLLSQKWGFDIATLDEDQTFSKFNVLTCEMKRSVLYDHFFCLVYPLKENHYGCGELGLQELLMLGYPVIVRRNSVETEITDGLSGVYFADSVTELGSVCLDIIENWYSLIEDWQARSAHNTKRINSRKPYAQLDIQLNRVYNRKSLRKQIVDKTEPLDVVKFAYNQKSEHGLNEICLLWEKSGHVEIPTKGSPSQFLKYFPDLMHLGCF